MTVRKDFGRTALWGLSMRLWRAIDAVTTCWGASFVTSLPWASVVTSEPPEVYVRRPDGTYSRTVSVEVCEALERLRSWSPRLGLPEEEAPTKVLDLSPTWARRIVRLGRRHDLIDEAVIVACRVEAWLKVTRAPRAEQKATEVLLHLGGVKRTGRAEGIVQEWRRKAALLQALQRTHEAVGLHEAEVARTRPSRPPRLSAPSLDTAPPDEPEVPPPVPRTHSGRPRVAPGIPPEITGYRKWLAEAGLSKASVWRYGREAHMRLVDSPGYKKFLEYRELRAKINREALPPGSVLPSIPGIDPKLVEAMAPRRGCIVPGATRTLVGHPNGYVVTLTPEQMVALRKTLALIHGLPPTFDLATWVFSNMDAPTFVKAQVTS